MSRQRIVITGASRGIGEALAREYAGPGIALVLIGRDRARLDMIADACRVAGAEAEAVVLDIRDRSAMAEGMRRLDEEGAIDLLVANAGIQLPTHDDPGEVASSFEEIETNFLGTLNTVVPMVARMAARRSGQIAVVSSLAGYVPLPDTPGYCSSKAGLTVWGLALRARLRPVGVKVSVVCPGYIDGGMGPRNKGRQPFLVPLDRTAAKIRAGLARNEAVVAFPFPVSWVARTTQLLPEWIGRLTQRSSRVRIDGGT